MVQQVKEPVFPLEQLGSLLWLGLDPGPRKFHGVALKEKKKKKKKRTNLFLIKSIELMSSCVAQQVKDPALSLLRCGFVPWAGPGNFHVPQVRPRERKK